MNDQEFARSTTAIPGRFSQRRGHRAKVVEQVDGAHVPVAGKGDSSVEMVETPETPVETVKDVSIRVGNDMPRPAAEISNGASPSYTFKLLPNLSFSPFWHDRLVECGLILSLGLYYLVGNTNFGASNMMALPPYLYSFPFLALFAFLSWYRLSFAVALVPLALPYYMIQKTVFSSGSHHLDFGLGEISVTVCALVALGQLLFYRKRWRYRLSWSDLRDRVGPFFWPILIFVAAALVSISVALSRSAAERAFREEVFDPLLYVLLALCCLRTAQDIKRLLGAFLGSALVIACIGLIQYFFFSDLSQQSTAGARAVAVYGSANSIGLFFDYVLPIALTLLMFQAGQFLHGRGKWWICVLLLASFVPLIGVLIFSQSLGTALALPVALLFILALSVRNRKVFLLGTGGLVLLFGLALALHNQIAQFVENWHANSGGIGTLTKRYYLWQVAIAMIRSYPWLGVGMDNWLCHYTENNYCPESHSALHYMTVFVPGTHMGTGLAEEPDLSHPHDIFLQVWVSIGIFGLLAFLAVLVLFYWLFARLFKTVHRSSRRDVASLEWMVLGIGGAMLAALCQGLADSSFLEQDLAFCFWMLVVALLILRKLTGVGWRGGDSKT